MFIWFILPGHSPSLKEVGGKTQVETEHTVHCLDQLHFLVHQKPFYLPSEGTVPQWDGQPL